jgi:hypothetical protein
MSMQLLQTRASNAGSLGRLSNILIQDILLFCDPRDVAQAMGTCALLYSVCAEGYLWRPLLFRHFPLCKVVPQGGRGGCHSCLQETDQCFCLY